MAKHEDKGTVLLKHHLKALKMPTILAECEKVAARCGQENVGHLGFLLQLCELELLDRERRAAERRLKAAKFPGPNTTTLTRIPRAAAGFGEFDADSTQSFAGSLDLATTDSDRPLLLSLDDIKDVP